MAIAEELRVQIKVEVDNALKNLNKVEKQSKNTLKGFLNMVPGPIKAAASFGALIAASKKLTGLYYAQEEAETALNAALRTTGAYSGNTARSLQEFASELQSVTTFGDEATLAAMGMLEQLGDLGEDGLKQVTPLVQDFAAAMGVDLQTAASLVGKTLGSSTNALSRYGIEIDATASKEDKLEQLTTALNDKFGGMAEQMAETSAGAMKQYQNAMGDLGEAIGGVIADNAEPFLKIMTRFAERVSEGINKAREFKEVIEAMGESHEDTAGRIGDVQSALEYIDAELERNAGRHRTLTYAKEAEYKADREALQKELRMLQQLQYQQALREDAADAALRRAEERKKEEERQAAELQAYLDEVYSDFAKTSEGKIEAIEAEIAKYEEYEKTANKTLPEVQAILRMLRKEHDQLTGSIELVTTESEVMVASILAGYETLPPKIKKVNDEIEATASIFEQTYSQIGSSTSAIVGSLSTIWSNYYDKQLEGLEEGSQEHKRILREQAAAEKGMALFQVAIDTATAIIGFLVNPGGPAGWVMSGLAAAAGAAQAGAIASAPMPALAEGGIVTKPTTALIGEAGPEAVVPLNKGFGNTTIHVHGSLIMQEQLETFIAGINAKNNRGY